MFQKIAFRQQCAWYEDKEYVKLSVERVIHTIKRPSDMPPIFRHQMAMDSVSWCLYWEKRHEFDHFLEWQAEFIRHLSCWLTEEEEDEFKRKCDSFYVGMESKAVSPDILELARLSQESSGIVRSATCSMHLAQ